MSSNLTSVLILVLGIYGGLLVIAKDTAVPDQLKSNPVFKSLYDNNLIAGVAIICIAYYFYSTLSHVESLSIEHGTTEMTSATPEMPLPSYESTSDLL